MIILDIESAEMLLKRCSSETVMYQARQFEFPDS